ncbi:hypothetical protein LZ32DRAFT_655888 [Colletotrichum eremochloae]|nr:hypothetical protein LZ32DRAFT_655888 [Colletotrichum eremochloae]
MPPRTKNAIIKEEEWTRVQPIIRRLYLLEDKSLKDVIGILSTFHNFRPSKAQLGSKLKQWHMTKNMTSLEWKGTTIANKTFLDHSHAIATS